jgi:hypothetical protein
MVAPAKFSDRRTRQFSDHRTRTITDQRTCTFYRSSYPHTLQIIVPEHFADHRTCTDFTIITNIIVPAYFTDQPIIVPAKFSDHRTVSYVTERHSLVGSLSDY